MKPLRVSLPLGIGDCHWVCTKLAGLSELHGNRPIHAYVNKLPYKNGSVGFLEIVPQVAKAIESSEALYALNVDLPENYRSHRWSTLDGCADWKGFDYVFCANGHLECGKPLSTFLPELETEYSYPLRISRADRAYARSLTGANPVVLYPSGIGPNRGFHRNTWTTIHWASVVARLNARGIVPVLVGADSPDDRDYRDEVMRVVHMAEAECVDLVGQTTIPQVLALIERARVWCGLNSGLGIIAAMRKIPTVMLWADSRYPMPGTPAELMHPNMQRSWLLGDQLETYRTLSYGSPELTPENVAEKMVEVMRSPKVRKMVAA